VGVRGLVVGDRGGNSGSDRLVVGDREGSSGK